MARGGYRPGAGRPKKAAAKPAKAAEPANRDEPQVAPPKPRGETPLAYMLSVMNDPDVDESRRDRMAIAAAPYVHGRVADDRAGKKEQRQDAADRAAEKFAVPAAPKLVVVNR